jgi:hypothetical protein
MPTVHGDANLIHNSDAALNMALTPDQLASSRPFKAGSATGPLT